MTDQTNSIVVKENSIYMPIMTIAEAIERHNALVNFTKSIMKKDHDFGIIPGTDKPTLYKAGAEKLCSFFGLVPKFNIVDKILDFDKGLFYYHYSCELLRNGQLLASGEGSANSLEKKHRYRNITEKKATEEDKAMSIRKETKTGKYGDYVVYVVPNNEPYDLVNTLQKMAQKRALVAAVLIGTNASEFYTQDLEDMNIIDGEWHEPEGEKKSQPQTQASKQNNNLKSEPVKNNKSAISPRIQCLVEAGIVLSIEEAAALLNKLNPSPDKTIEEIIEMAHEFSAPSPEPVTEQPPEPAKSAAKPREAKPNENPRVAALIDAGVVQFENEAEVVLGKLKLAESLPVEEVVKIVRGFYGWKELGSSDKQAIEYLSKGDYPK